MCKYLAILVSFPNELFVDWEIIEDCFLWGVYEMGTAVTDILLYFPVEEYHTETSVFNFQLAHWIFEPGLYILRSVLEDSSERN